MAELFDSLSQEDISVICALHEEGILMDLRMGKDYLSDSRSIR
ncbi:hypothetical protein [Virgibacillus dokdonensis]